MEDWSWMNPINCDFCGTPRLTLDVIEGRYTTTQTVCPNNDCESYTGVRIPPGTFERLGRTQYHL